MTARRHRREAERTELPSFEVYDGRHYAGAVAEVAPGAFEAFGADARSLGRFPNARAAQDAVLTAWRASGGA